MIEKNEFDYFFLYKGNISKRPPVITLIRLILKKKKKIIVLVDEIDKDLSNEFKRLGALIIELNIKSQIIGYSRFDKVFYWLEFRKKVKKQLVSYEYRYIWFCSADTAISLKGLYENIDYYISIYELYDSNKIYKYFLNNILTLAKKVIVPEETRASIFKFWYKLKNKPIVLPNKPIPIENHLQLVLSEEVKSLMSGDKKIILYQGGIAKKARNLTPLCQAMKHLSSKWQLVLMGPKDPYIEELKTIYPELIYIPYIKPPLHLKVTELVDLCIVSYHYSSLNNLFCAPNKIWEYSMFGKPMLCNDIPGLKQTVEKFNAGICVDMDDSNAIINAINSIEEDYAYYSNNALLFYNSIDLEGIVDRIVVNNKKGYEDNS